LEKKQVRRDTKFGFKEDRSVYTSGNTNNSRRYAGIDKDDPASRYKLDNFTTTDIVQGVDNKCFGGLHPGVVQFVLCDGSVRGIQRNIDINTLSRLAHREDGQAVGDF